MLDCTGQGHTSEKKNLNVDQSKPLTLNRKCFEMLMWFQQIRETDKKNKKYFHQTIFDLRKQKRCHSAASRLSYLVGHG